MNPGDLRLGVCVLTRVLKTSKFRASTKLTRVGVRNEPQLRQRAAAGAAAQLTSPAHGGGGGCIIETAIVR